MLDTRSLYAMANEITKLAAFSLNPRYGNPLLTAGAAGGVGAVGGGLLGGAMGMYRGYNQAKDSGLSTGDALRSGLSTGLGYAGRGALLGGGLGAVGGGIAGAVNPNLGKNIRTTLSKVPGGQFGQRQVHALTGATPEEGLKAIGMGAHGHLAGIEQAEKRLAANEATWRDKLLGRDAAGIAKARMRDVENARKDYELAAKVENMGLHSIPGIAASMKNNGVGETAKTLVKNQFGTRLLSPQMALGVGLPAYGMYKTLTTDDPEERKNRPGNIIKNMGSIAAGTLFSPLPMVSGMLAQTPIEAGFRHLGDTVNKRYNHPSPPPPPTPSGYFGETPAIVEKQNFGY